MRILFVSTLSYPPQDAGGSKSSTHELCLKMQEKGHHVALLCGLGNEGIFGLWTRFRRKLSRKYNYPMDRFLHYPAYRGWFEAQEGIPSEVIERFKPDIAVADAGQTILMVKALVEKKIPTICYLRDIEFHKMGAEPFEHPLISYIANSCFTASVLKKKFGLYSSVIPPLVTPERYQVSTTNRKSVLHINPHPIKGIDITMQLARLRPDIPFTIIESWDLNNEILSRYREMANQLQNVVWKERSHDMRQIYQHTHIILAPSMWEEAWGRIATEGHVNGIPVIASTRGGLPESVGPGGILVDPDSPIDNWLSALTTLWDNTEEYKKVSMAARQYSKRKEIQPAFLLNKFESVLSKHIQETG